MFTFKNKSIQVYLDGPTLEEMKTADENLIDGYTFNPTLFKNLNAKNYINFSKKILSLNKNKPVSLEIIADDEKETIRQAKKLSRLSSNVNVKVPITFTNRQSTKKVIKELLKSNISLNITAIFTIQQVQEIIEEIQDSDTILSIFAGRLYDIGMDAKEKMMEITSFVRNNSKCRVLWASPRMSYDVLSAIDSNVEIITLQNNLISKIKLFNKSPTDYSLETVKMFYNDAKAANYKI